uniref:Uncharacterized protein n=1 Tax=Leersia perrieri TaxID=77586 RepID=A0A0D9WMM1_9ORYZ
MERSIPLHHPRERPRTANSSAKMARRKLGMLLVRSKGTKVGQTAKKGLAKPDDLSVVPSSPGNGLAPTQRVQTVQMHLDVGATVDRH